MRLVKATVMESKMPHIWIINHYADSPSGSSGIRHYSLSVALKKCGWSSTVISSNIDHSTGKKRSLMKERMRKEDVEGVPFLWIKGPEYASDGLARMFNMLIFFLRMLPSSTTNILPNPDIIMGSTVHPLAALAGLILSKRKKVPFVYEIRDLWPRTLIDMGKIKENGIVAKLLGGLETYLYEQASTVVTLLPNVDEYFADKGLPTEKIVWISNGVDIEKFPLTVYDAQTELSEFKLMYVGAHGNANCLYTLLNAYKKFTDLQASEHPLYTKLVLIGSGNLKSALKAYAGSLSVSGGDIEFWDSVPKDSVSQVLQTADAFVITVRDLPELYRYGISTVSYTHLTLPTIYSV